MKKPATTTQPPPVVIVDGADKVSFAIHVTGGAALTLRTAASMEEDGLHRSIAYVLAGSAACTLADSNPQETPAYAELFGLETEAAA